MTDHTALGPDEVIARRIARKLRHHRVTASREVVDDAGMRVLEALPDPLARRAKTECAVCRLKGAMQCDNPNCNEILF